MKTLIIYLTAMIGLASETNLTGRWETKPSEKGNTTGVVFKQDNTYEGYVNKKPFVSGTYTFNESDSVITIHESSCNGVTGIYKVNLFSNADSMRFTAIQDSCTERREGMQRLVLGRVKR